MWLSAEDGGPFGGVKPHFHVADILSDRAFGLWLTVWYDTTRECEAIVVIAAYDFGLSSTYAAPTALSFASFLIALLAKLCRQTLPTLVCIDTEQSWGTYFNI